MAGGLEFNRSKFKELVVYFAQRSESADDEGFGMVKLNKLLYRADFQAFRLLGRSITGETYEKQEFGPVARDLPLVLDDLARQGRLTWSTIPRGPHKRKVPRASTDMEAQPDLTQFTEAEHQLMEAALSDLATHGGRSASDWSHEHSAGWNVARNAGDVIPYETELIETEPIPAEDLQRASRLVRERGWLRPAH